MSDRTDARDAMVQLCWYLNYHDGESLSVNQIAEETGLAWATVHNTLITLEQVQRLAPDVTKDDDGVHVGKPSERVEDLKRDDAIAAVTYMLTQRKNTGDLTAPFVIEDHTALQERYDALENADSLDWVSLNKEAGTVTLESTGIGIAGPAHSRLQNLD